MDTKDLTAISDVRRLIKGGGARAIRLAAGVSLAEMADVVRCSPTTIHKWEMGDRSPRGSAALAYAEVLKALSEGRRPTRRKPEPQPEPQVMT